jgi:hypothetical protein
MVANIDEIMVRFNVHYFAIGPTLQGVLRYGRPIPWISTLIFAINEKFSPEMLLPNDFVRNEYELTKVLNFCHALFYNSCYFQIL